MSNWRSFSSRTNLISIKLYTIVKRHLFCVDIIRFSVTRKCQKIRKIDENSKYWRKKSSYLLNDVRNFDEILRKGKTWKIIKITKKTGLHTLSRNYQRVCQINRPTPPLLPPVYLGWRDRISCTLIGKGYQVNVCAANCLLFCIWKYRNKIHFED